MMTVQSFTKNIKWIEYPRMDGRMEWMCEHGVGHGNHVHGCDGCCQHVDYPGRNEQDLDSSTPSR